MNCKICGHVTEELFKAKALQKYLVQYYKCNSCGFIQTEKAFWLNEAYQSAITSPDVGLAYRNILFSNIVDKIIIKFFDYKSKFLDYAGGYGLFVRLMRDKGFDYYRQDPYCENIFAKNLDVVDLPKNQKFELATAFEVFEHWENPLEEVEKILDCCSSILFSTELQPNKKIVTENDWWYFIPETGQHISFYTVDSLKVIAGKYKLNFFTNGINLHLFTSKSLTENPFEIDSNKFQEQEGFLKRKIKNFLKATIRKPLETPVQLQSLIEKDGQDALKRLRSEVS